MSGKENKFEHVEEIFYRKADAQRGLSRLHTHTRARARTHTHAHTYTHAHRISARAVTFDRYTTSGCKSLGATETGSRSLALLLGILEVMGSSLGRDTSYGDYFCTFPQYLQGHSGTVPYIFTTVSLHSLSDSLVHPTQHFLFFLNFWQEGISVSCQTTASLQ
jgi:hypothetical protein